MQEQLVIKPKTILANQEITHRTLSKDIYFLKIDNDHNSTALKFNKE